MLVSIGLFSQSASAKRARDVCALCELYRVVIALSLLFVARIGFRLFRVAILTGPDTQLAAQDFGRSPLTIAVVGMMAGNYTWYAIVRWSATSTHVYSRTA